MGTRVQWNGFILIFEVTLNTLLTCGAMSGGGGGGGGGGGEATAGPPQTPGVLEICVVLERYVIKLQNSC